jgi:rod shape-determining protein MreD
MSTFDPASSSLRLRGGPARAARRHPVDAAVSVAPRFSLLVLLAVAAVLAQSTLLHGATFRGAHVSLVTVLLVWTGLRCGVVTGGWLGFIAGLLEDALGGGGSNVLSATLVGFLSGMLANRFFSDSLPVFLAALVGATAIRFAAMYLFFEFVYGERGLFGPMSHEFAWATVLNCVVGTVVLLGLRLREQWSMRLR